MDLGLPFCALVLRQEFANDFPFILRLNATEELLSQLDHCLRPIKGQAFVHRAAAEVARLTARENRPDLSGEINFFRPRSRCGYFVECWCRGVSGSPQVNQAVAATGDNQCQK